MTDGISLPPSATDIAQLLLGRSSGSISLGKAVIVDVALGLSGQTVNGDVVAAAQNGTVTVQTESGDQVTIKPKVPLTVGQKVSVEIPPENPVGQTVTIKLAPSSSQTNPVSPQSAQPTPVVVEDTVSSAIQNRANVTLQSIADTVQLGRPVRAVLFETPIRFNNEAMPNTIQTAEYLSGENNAAQSPIKAQQPMSMHEVLQQGESKFMSPVSLKTDILLQQFVQRNMIAKNDVLIRMILGLQDSNESYKPLSPLQTKTVDLPLLNRSFSILNTQTSTLSLQPFTQNIAMQHFGIDLPDLAQTIKAFQGNIQNNILATNLLDNNKSMMINVRFVQVQNPLGIETATTAATVPQTVLNAPQTPQSFFTLGDVIDADMPESNLLRNLQNPINTLNPVQHNDGAVKPQLLSAFFLGQLSAKQAFAIQDGANSKMVTIPNMITAHSPPSGNVTPSPTPQTMGLWATPLGIMAVPITGNAAPDVGQNAVIQMDATNGLSAVLKPVLSFVQPITATSVTGITNDIPPLDSVLGSDWPALQQSIEALFDINVALARSFMANIPMPSSPPQFTPAVIFFLAALRVGNLKAWTGEKMIDALERAGKGDLVKRLSGDFIHASARSKEPISDGWRPFHIPILYDENLSRLQFMVRQDDENNEGNIKSAGKKSTRFLIDLVLSRIGEIQLDGYIRGKNLDMVVRTKEHLPSDMQQNIRQRFTHAVEMTGMNGSIRMFGRGEGWVKVERPSGASGVRV